MGPLEHPRHLGHAQQRVRVRVHCLCDFLELLASENPRDAREYEL